VQPYFFWQVRAYRGDGAGKRYISFADDFIRANI